MVNIFISFRLGFPQIMKLSKSHVETGCLASSPRHNHSSDRKCTLKLVAYFVSSPLFFSISLLKKGQYFHISSNLGFVLEQISLISLKSKKFKDEIF